MSKIIIIIIIIIVRSYYAQSSIGLMRPKSTQASKKYTDQGIAASQ